MKFSSKIQRCELSPMRKFLPYELAAEAKGRKIYHLNIGQPDIETPKAFFDAVKNFQDPVLAYAAAPGVSEFLTAVQATTPTWASTWSNRTSTPLPAAARRCRWP